MLRVRFRHVMLVTFCAAAAACAQSDTVPDPGDARMATFAARADGHGTLYWSLSPAVMELEIHEPDVSFLAFGEQLRLLPGLQLSLRGAALPLVSPAGQHTVDTLTLTMDPDASTELVLRDGPVGPVLLDVGITAIERKSNRRGDTLRLEARLRWRIKPQTPDDSNAQLGTTAGRLSLDIPVQRILAADAEDHRRRAAGECTLNPGPDVIVGSLLSCRQFGRVGEVGAGKVGLSIGTISCNKGCDELNWFALPDTDHPLIGMNLYRLQTIDGSERFEQIGHSWLKHGFTAFQEDNCQFGCISSGTGQRLGVGCSDPYSTSLNSNQCGLGAPARLNPFTGALPEGGVMLGSPCIGQNFPSRNHEDHLHDDTAGGEIAHRLQVLDTDLDSILNEGSRYFGEAQYISAQEFNDPEGFANRNMFNNVSHREVVALGPSEAGEFLFNWVDNTQRESPAIDAWTSATVVTLEPEPGLDGQATLLYAVTDLGAGTWHYEYAIYNMNLDRSIGTFSIPIPPDVDVSNIEFHAPPNHDDPGVIDLEKFSNDPWDVTLGDDAVSWSTTPFDQDTQGNAVRFGTLYNFRFDANTAPEPVEATIGLFKTGDSMIAATLGPRPFIPITCGDGRVDPGEECDPPDEMSCGKDCQWICGDGIIQGDEECDPPDGMSCNAFCELEPFCGDGLVEEEEECDPPDGVTCDDACQRIPTCGDGILDPGEICDDGNTEPGDGCDENCLFENNDMCAMANPIGEGTFLVININATTDGPAHPECEQSGDGGQTAFDLWFLYTAECSGNLQVSTCAAAKFDTDLVIYDGADCKDLQLLDCNDDAFACPDNTSSVLNAEVQAGREYLIRAGGWSEQFPDQSMGPAFMTVSHDATPCKQLGFVTSVPPNDAIDARQPSELDGSNPSGWDGIDITFDDDPVAVVPADFELLLEPEGPKIDIASVEADGNTLRVNFTQPLPPGYWARLTYLAGGDSVRIGFLPADVNGDGTSGVLDILGLIDHLNGIEDWPEYGADVDRSGLSTPSDIIRVIDLLNGAEAFEVWNGRTLPE